jgi:hypothetical protein
MATTYLRSTDGNDADDGSTWALADATSAAAATAQGAGGTTYVSQAHAESVGAAITVTFASTVDAMGQFLCANDAATPPTALATTATVTNTGANAQTWNGSEYVYGITLNVGTGATSASLNLCTAAAEACQVWDTCNFNIVNTGNAAHINVTVDNVGVAQRVIFKSCGFSFGNAAGRLRIGSGAVEIIGGSLGAGVALPTTFISMQQTSARSPRLIVRNFDASALGSGKNLVDAATMKGAAMVRFIDCKLGASVAFTTGAFTAPGPFVESINSDSGNTNYRYYRISYQGEVLTETTIARTGGATTGTTPYSIKMVSTANTRFFSPLESIALPFWNDSLTAQTVSMPVVTDNVTLKDNEAWIEIEYLGTSGFPLALTASDRATDILTTAANQTTDSTSAWTTTGLTTPIKQSLSTTFTPTLKGWYRARVMLAKASTTLYFDPKVGTASQRQYISEGGTVNQQIPRRAYGSRISHRR